MELKGWSICEAASHLGITPRYLYYLLSLTEAPHEVKRLLKKWDPFIAARNLGVNHPYLRMLPSRWKLQGKLRALMKLKGWNEFVAATNLGINDHYLRTLLSLLEAPQKIKRLVEEEKIDPSTAGGIVYLLKDKPREAVEVEISDSPS
jgi:hypothetical protein